MTEKCNGWCKWLKEQYTLPYGYAFTCTAANNKVIVEGKSEESLTGKWRSQVRSPIVNVQLCLTPKQKEVIKPEDLPYGGIDPFAVSDSESGNEL